MAGKTPKLIIVGYVDAVQTDILKCLSVDKQRSECQTTFSTGPTRSKKKHHFHNGDGLLLMILIWLLEIIKPRLDYSTI